MLKKFIKNRKGTAEVIGSTLFIIIIIFFFSNVYLWHDQANREMNNLQSDKMNSPVTITCTPMNLANNRDRELNVTNTGGVDVTLSRLWVTTDLIRLPINLTGTDAGQVMIKAGGSINMTLLDDGTELSSVNIKGTTKNLIFDFLPTMLFRLDDPTLTFKILTTLGNTAACKYS